MNYRIKFHITNVKYSESLIFHLKIPYIVYAWNGNKPLSETEDYKTFGITEEKPQGEEYIDVYWNTIDDEDYDTDDEGKQLDTISNPFFRLSTNFSLGIGPYSDDMPGPYTIKQLWKEEEKSFNFILSENAFIECTISLDEIGPKRLINSDYKLGTDPDHMTDLYNIIETDKNFGLARQELSDFKINNSQNNIPIQYIPYENNEQYLFPTQVNWNRYQYKNALQKKEGLVNKSFFLDYKPFPINVVPNYIYDLYSQPKDWGYFADSTANDNKYSYKIWKNNDNICILKGTWTTYSEQPNEWYNPDNPLSSSPKQINCKYSNIILDLQAAGGKGGDGNSDAWSYRPTNTGGCGGGGGAFVRCLIDINQYTQSEPLQITLTPQNQNTSFKQSTLPYSYIIVKEGQINCYNGQPGHKQERTIWGSDPAYTDRDYFNPGGIGGIVTYYLHNSSEKILNYTTNQSNPWYQNNKGWVKTELTNFQWDEVKRATSPDGNRLTSNYTIPSPISYPSSSYTYQYYNANTENDIIVSYKNYSVTLPHANVLDPSIPLIEYYYVKIKSDSWTDSIINNYDYISLTNQDESITLRVNYEPGDYALSYNSWISVNKNSIQDSLKDVDVYWGSTLYSENISTLYYNITNATKEIFNDARTNMTCKIISDLSGQCGGNNTRNHSVSDGDKINNIFSWKQNEIELPFNGIINWGKGGVGCPGKRYNTIATITYEYLGGAGGGGSIMGYGQNGYNIHNITNDSGFPNPSSFQTDTNYWGGGGGGGCYFYESASWHHYVNGSKGQPAGFIIHW